MHMIEFLNGKHSIAWSGETPWHGLGKQVPADLTPEQMLEAAGLDWTVEKVPAYVNYNGEEIATGQHALIRDLDGQILTNISDDWEPLQNSEAFGFFHEYVMAGDMEMHTAGSLRDGRMVWGLAKIKSSFELFGGDQVDNYLLFSNPHEYGKGIDIRVTPIRVVCNNTLTLAVSNSADKMIRINHRTKFDAEEVKRTLGFAERKFEVYKEMAEFLGSKKAKEADVVKFLSEVFPRGGKVTEEDADVKLSRPAQVIYDILETQPGAEFAPGTWWAAFNGVTFATDHLLGNTQDTRLNSSWYGANRAKKLIALEKAVEYAEAS
jgi:phage/plasmid-like protein (TIGR03299 family)